MIVSNWLTIGHDELSKTEWRKLFQKLRFTDAEGVIYEPWRYSVRKNAVIIPRGAWNLIPDHVEYKDRRVLPKGRFHEFMLDLDAELPDGRKFKRQKAAVKSMLEQEQGLVNRPPGTGKTQIALAFVAVCESPALVLVHTEDILQQWIENARAAIPSAIVGVIRAEEISVGDITIATIQTFGKVLHENLRRWQSRFGVVILDEAHHAPASTFEQVMNMMKSRYRFGLTATLTRADGKQAYMRTVIGPVIHKLKFESPIPVSVRPLKTGFYYPYRGSWDWTRLVDALVTDEVRNKAIAEAADEEVRAGNSVLILSRRIEHLQLIAETMETFSDSGALLVGSWYDYGIKRRMTRELRKSIIHLFRNGEIKVVLATQLADEALDVPILSRVFLVHPGKHDGRIIQQVGRALREYPGKKDAVIYDVADDRVIVLRRQWMRRKQVYKRLGFEIQKTKRRKNG
jgi:superfamily II DNA or RNA helicase